MFYLLWTWVGEPTKQKWINCKVMFVEVVLITIRWFYKLTLRLLRSKSSSRKVGSNVKRPVNCPGITFKKKISASVGKNTVQWSFPSVLCFVREWKTTTKMWLVVLDVGGVLPPLILKVIKINHKISNFSNYYFYHLINYTVGWNISSTILLFSVVFPFY